MKSSHLFKRSLRSTRGGFTLFEMLLVLSIIALLMGFVIFKLSGVTKGAQSRKAQADILTLKEALISYQMVAGSVPTTEQGLKALWSKPTTEPVPSHWIKQMDEEVKDPWNRSYQYMCPGKHNPDSYDVYSLGPTGQPDSPDVIGNWSDSATN